jgi:hypothetical protein
MIRRMMKTRLFADQAQNKISILYCADYILSFYPLNKQKGKNSSLKILDTQLGQHYV